MSALPYFQLMRIPAVFTAISNIVAAHLIVSQGKIQWGVLLLLAAASSFLYTGGMVLNDCFDAVEDATECPSRPIPSGAIGLHTAWLFGAVLLAIGILLASLVGFLQLVIAGVLVLLILFYNGVAKNRVFAAPAMGSCRLANWVLGLSVTGVSAITFLLALPVFFYVTSLTILSKVETTARSRTPLIGCIAGMLATGVTVLLLTYAGVLPHQWALIPLLIALVLVLKYLLITLNKYTPEQIQQTIMLLVLGIIPLDAIMVFAGGPWWGGIIILMLWFPGRLLARLINVT